MAELRRAFIELVNNGIKNPVIIKRTYNANFELLRLYASTDFGALLADGLGDAVWLSASLENRDFNKRY